MTPRTPPADHADHDVLLVAALAAGDTSPAEREIAEAQLRACPECAALAADLTSIARATAALPPAQRPRDFFLTPADARRLRPTGWRRLLGWLAAPSSLARPLAASFTTLGVAGLLLAGLSGLSLSFGSAGAAPAASSGQYLLPAGQDSHAEATAGAGAKAPSPADGRGSALYPSAAASAPVPGASEPAVAQATPIASTHGATAGPAAPPTASVTAGAVDLRDQRTEASSQGANPLVLGSAALLLVGVGLFALRAAGRRLSG